MRNVNQIVSLAHTLRSRYSDRDMRYENNYHAYKGDYDLIMGGNYMPVNLQDVRRTNSAATQVWNLIKPLVDTYRLLINKLPGIRVPPTEYGRPEEAGKAERLEKLYYAIWDASQLSRRHGEAAFDIALDFATVWMTRWDPKLDHPVIVGRSPKTCYPISKRYGDELGVCIFMWEEFADELVENIPEAKSLLSAAAARSDQKVEVIEYLDDKDYMLIINGQGKNMVPWGGSHNLGYVPACVTAGAHIRGELFPPGMIDQLVAVNDHGNRMLTKWGVALEASLFGREIIEGPGADEVVLNSTPGGVTRITDPETHHTYVQPKPPPREVFGELERIQDFFRTHALWPASASGEMQGSIVTGKAVSRLQGVMASMAAEADDNLGRDLARCNSWAAQMMEQYRPSKKFVLYSGASITALSSPGRPQGFKVEIIPERDINGYYRNELMYSPFGSDTNSVLTVGMQAVQAEIFSRRYLRNLWPGISDAEAMAREIDEEKESRMRLEMKLQAEAQAAAAQIQMQAQQAMLQQQAPPGAGGPPPAGPPGQMPPEGMPPEGMPPEGMPLPPDMAPGQGAGGPLILPEGRPFVMGMGEPLSGAENFPLPTENVLPYNQALDQLAPREGQPTEEGTSADEVIAAIGQVEKLRGSVYLVGDIAQRGATTGNIELALTSKLDKQTLINALPQYRGRLSFTIVPQGQMPPGAIPINEMQAVA